jgi:CheY-like chemotaxis protein
VARILIVDDDEADRVLVQTVLTHEGHETYLAEDGEAALASVRETPVDVVVTDLQMPNTHGLELISVLRELSPRPAIVAISGTGETQLDVAGAVGADASLTKPLTHASLLGGIRQALEAAEARRVSGAGPLGGVPA